MKQFIKCPECGAIELGTIDTTTIPWNSYIHNCNNCDYIIMESEWDNLKALSIKQPWAGLIAHGEKDIENRNNLKNFRGTFLIHASLQFDYNWFHSKVFDAGEKVHDLTKGAIIGYADIVDCVTESDSKWFVGKYGFVIKNAKLLPVTPCKGKLSFFNPEII